MKRIEEYARKPDHDTGLQMIRYGGRWVIRVAYWGCDGTASVERIDGSLVDLPCSRRGFITLPNGKRTRQYYH